MAQLLIEMNGSTQKSGSTLRMIPNVKVANTAATAFSHDEIVGDK